MTTGTVRLHRVLRAPPERVYRAFLDADAMASGYRHTVSPARFSTWMPRLGAPFGCRSPNFTTGNGHSFGGEYLELVPHERIRYTDKFDDPNLPGEIQVTVALTKVSCGTEINIVQEGCLQLFPLRCATSGGRILLRNLQHSSNPRSRAKTVVQCQIGPMREQLCCGRPGIRANFVVSWQAAPGIRRAAAVLGLIVGMPCAAG